MSYPSSLSARLRAALRGTTSLLAAFTLSGCLMVGPRYKHPAPVISARFKELQPAPGWTVSQPDMAAIPKGKWWLVYNDPTLNALEDQVALSNQNLKEYEAQYRKARAMVNAAKASLYPTLSGDLSFARNSQGSTATSTSGTTYSTGSTRNTYAAELSADWDLDLWGKIRRQIQEQVTAAQASAADIANARLSYQSQLAQDYFEMRYEESLKSLLDQSAALYAHNLEIIRNQHEGGTLNAGDELQAETELQQTRASATATDVARSEYEHAIAVLVGRAPADLTIARAAMPSAIPAVPVTLPATLLQRRPDIAAAERGMVEYNAEIGAAIAAFYPDVTLSAAYGYSGNPVQSLIQVANRIWSLGAAGSETLFEGGARTAAVQEANADYDNAVATYRQTVLTALQDTEDQLSSLRILEQQAGQQDAAVRAAVKAVDVAMNEYRFGTAIYTTVITTQQTALGDQESALQIQENRLLASVKLIADLGGGWDVSQLPSKNSLQRDNPLVPSFLEKHPRQE
ncbi:efflux transporter outer membrane subunit [Komagataeibacter rhaeticus]|uniref:efflux transporter outer membrane subunit n=1 Tax=Komagataeibacter rhaeticus TaxID=215221 RepID=UPI000587D5F7|nr:efflux transporter outer membrane subunit [Komagataeibacter rhaeticus]ATU74309.1 secretion protein [Komagataeibacter xylinus]QOC47565.1 efflux transporter outer membrane subunit [Komagataeibacter rhaeticus]WPP22633.1 efflux transporter outer membrane subunit [Komagataeibacter rhaeticus]SAY46813.1 Toluene efflux pump outer membrane protein TtgI precursor [Komagataeibacter rhaeticus]SAY50026.1 Toluene efflux pump outer membrane protein TtgI precursor [Komagataeibacter rhaeticus]